MRTKRSMAAIAAAVAVATSLAGCSSGTNAGGSSDSKTLTWEGFSGDATVKPIIADFEKQNPGITVKFTGLPYPQILTQINTQLVSGTAPDVVTVFPGTGNPIAVQNLAKNGYLADLTGQSWTSQFSDTRKQVMGVDGKVYLAANNFTIIPAIYNVQAMADVNAQPPTTYSEVLDLCKTARADGKVAFALGGVGGGNLSFLGYALSSTLVYGPNPNFATEQADGKVTFADSKWTTVLQQMQDMDKAGCFSKDPLGVSIDDAQSQVAKGDALGIVTVSNQISTIAGMAPSGTTFETAPLPATDDAAQTYLPVGLGAGYGVNAKSKNAALAEKFIEFYMSTQGVKDAIDAGSIFPSVDVGDFKHDTSLDGVIDQAAGDKTTGFPDAGWPNSNLQQVYFDALQKVLGGTASISSALDQMDAAFKQ